MLHTFPNRFSKALPSVNISLERTKIIFIKNDTWNNFRDTYLKTFQYAHDYFSSYYTIISLKMLILLTRARY